MPKGGSSSREDLIAKKLDLEREMYDYLIELVEQKAIVERTIRALEQPYRNILDFRYIEDMSLVEVAVKENYSYRQCKRLLKEAYVKYAEKREKL
jgi:DNA-directed RNA polymerase specialized sigma24 family protein